MAASLPSVSDSAEKSMWTTPGILRAAFAGIWLSALAFVLTLVAGAFQRWNELRTIHHDITPRIIAAQRIKAGLSDMDATAADVLLLPHNAQQEQCDDRYETRRIEVTESLATLAQGNAHTENELQAIRALSDALGIYENDVAVARLLHLRGQSGSRLVFRVTHSEMHDTLLPAADAFSKAVRDNLETTYKQRQVETRITWALGWGFGLLLLTFLIAAQIFLSRRTRRTLNLGLLTATVIALWLLFSTHRLFSQDDAAFQTTRASFDAVSDLWQIRALTFDADAEESRWLMDTPQAPQYEQAYQSQSLLILAPPAGQPLETLFKQGALPDGATGGLANAARNAISETARSAAADALVAYGAFVQTDKRLRALEGAGHHSAAVNFCVGRGPGEHDRAFIQFDAMLAKMLTGEKSVFDSATTEGLRRFVGYNPLAALALLAILVASGMGLRARLREYAF